MLRRFLGSPAGVLALIGASLLAAAVLAVVAISQRGFFDKYIREKYTVPPARFAELAPALRGRTNGVVKVRALPPDERAGLYQAWMQAADQWPAAAPAAMVWADPPLYLTLAHRTLLCGSAPQRHLAIRFLRWSSHPQAVPLLERVRASALRQREPTLAEAAQGALDSFRQGLRFGPEATNSNNKSH